MIDEILAKLPEGVFTLRDRVAQVVAIFETRLERIGRERDDAIGLANDALSQVDPLLKSKWGLQGRLDKLMKRKTDE
jgi:hypothetical protein